MRKKDKVILYINKTKTLLKPSTERTKHPATSKQVDIIPFEPDIEEHCASEPDHVPDYVDYSGQYDSIGNRDDSHQIFVIQDYELGTRKLSCKFVILSCLVVEFKQGPSIIFYCNKCCCPTNFSNYFGVDWSHLDTPETTHCLHIDIIIDILFSFHRVATLSGLALVLNTNRSSITIGIHQTRLYCKQFGRLIVMIDHSALLILMGVKTKNFKTIAHCFYCASNGCGHIPATEELPDDLYPNRLVERSREQLRYISGRSYPFLLFTDQELVGKVNGRAIYGLCWYTKNFICENDILYIVNDILSCCGRQISYFTKDGVITGQKCTIIGRSLFMESVLLCKKICAVCNKVFDYQEKLDSNGLLSLGDRYLFPVELFYDQLSLKYEGGVSTRSWWNSILESNYSRLIPGDPNISAIKNLYNIGGSINEIQTGLLKSMVYPDDSTFQCCENPDAICIDGIVSSIMTIKINEKKLKTPYLIPDPIKNRAKLRKDRNCLDLKKDKLDLIHKYAREYISCDEFNLIPDSVFKTLIRHIGHINNIYHCPDILKDFYSGLTKVISPAIQLIPKLCWENIDLFIQSKSITDLDDTLLFEHAPAIWNVILYMKRSLSIEVFQSVVFILEYIVQRARFSVQTTVKNIIPIDQYDGDVVLFDSPREEYNATGVYFPGRPVRNYVTNCLLSDTKGCTKTYKSTGVFGAGLLIFWCARHRKCLGFVLLQSAESPKIVYETLATRFEKLPTYIIYDNGCCLMEYCFNRQPDFFQDSIFLSDGFHWLNHINCGSYFNSSAYPCISDLCSVTHEQKNATIAKVSHIVIHMRYDSFFELILYLLHRLNQKENK